jgi:hypothetical protein
MADLSTLLGEERKSDFGAVRSVGPEAEVAPALPWSLLRSASSVQVRGQLRALFSTLKCDFQYKPTIINVMVKEIIKSKFLQLKQIFWRALPWCSV